MPPRFTLLVIVGGKQFHLHFTEDIVLPSHALEEPGFGLRTVVLEACTLNTNFLPTWETLSLKRRHSRKVVSNFKAPKMGWRRVGESELTICFTLQAGTALEREGGGIHNFTSITGIYWDSDKENLGSWSFAQRQMCRRQRRAVLGFFVKTRRQRPQTAERAAE